MPRYNRNEDDDIDRDRDDEYRYREYRYGPEELEGEEEAEMEGEKSEAIRLGRKKVIGPAIGMILFGILGIIGGAGYGYSSAPTPGAGPGAAVTGIFFVFLLVPLILGIVCCAFSIAAGIALLNGRRRGLVVAGAIVACLPSLGCLTIFISMIASGGMGLSAIHFLLLGLFLFQVPLTIWTFAAINHPDTIAYFERDNPE